MNDSQTGGLSTIFSKLTVINQNLATIFPNSNEPYQIMTRLLEECGELAQQVHHFEDSGVKRQKLGEPDRPKLAKEVQDVLRCVLQIVDYYDIEEELLASINFSYEKAQANILKNDSQSNSKKPGSPGAAL
jgi:NTP pyrophosphatase (non-canonical NTP hydrolase)